MEFLRYFLQYKTDRHLLLPTLVPLFTVFFFGVGCDSTKDSLADGGYNEPISTSGTTGSGAGVGTIGTAIGGSAAVSGASGSAASFPVSGSSGAIGIIDSGINSRNDGGGVSTGGSGGTTSTPTAGKGSNGVAIAGTFGSDANTSGTSGSDADTAGTFGSDASATDCPRFSFFVTSLEAMRRESGSQDGFGGDLGGLAGADDLCRRIAESVLECAGSKKWRAFLSTSTEDAIDRVGQGPWYDAVGRTVALSVADLLNTRPANADPAIARDLPNEYGTPNHTADGVTVDNHDTLTGSNAQGRYIGSASGTCNDWTSSEASGRPQIGHSWPGGPSEHWMYAHTAPGCAPGVNLSDRGGPGQGSCVGCSGGYGGFYCFALQP